MDRLTPDERLALNEDERITGLLELMQSKARLSLKQARLSSSAAAGADHVGADLLTETIAKAKDLPYY